MAEIKMLVYFDIEAIGLKSSERSRIIYISFVAVNAQDILNTHKRLLSHLKVDKSGDPLCVSYGSSNARCCQ